jgi:hypothetical protein
MSEIKRPIFVLRLQPLPRVDAIKALRAALKNLLRQFGLRALSVEQEPPDKEKENSHE